MNPLIKPPTNLLDPRSAFGKFSRGANIYNGTSFAAHSGPGSVSGRPLSDDNRMKEAFIRRLKSNFSPQPNTISGPMVGQLQKGIGNGY